MGAQNVGEAGVPGNVVGFDRSDRNGNRQVENKTCTAQSNMFALMIIIQKINSIRQTPESLQSSNTNTVYTVLPPLFFLRTCTIP